MSETVAGAVAALRATAGMLDEAARSVEAVDPGPAAFGAGGPGRLGDAGRELYLGWRRALSDRAHEARAQGARLDDLADLVGRAAGGLHEVNRAAERGQSEVM